MRPLVSAVFFEKTEHWLLAILLVCSCDKRSHPLASPPTRVDGSASDELNRTTLFRFGCFSSHHEMPPYPYVCVYRHSYKLSIPATAFYLLFSQRSIWQTMDGTALAAYNLERFSSLPRRSFILGDPPAISDQCTYHGL